MKSIQFYISSVIHIIYNRPLYFYLLLAALIFWPLTFLVYSVQYDMLDVVLPWRHYAAECFQNGLFPLWNPYQQGGYPIYADLQYPIWYPEIFFMSILFGYSAITINLLLVLYIGLAGLGMYKLAREFNINHHYALLAGMVFMLSGIFVGHAQSLVSILGATWLPWVMAYYLRLLKHSSFSMITILKLVLVTFLMLTGGYQAVSFMLFYVLIALFLLTTYALLRKKQYTRFKNLLLSHVTVSGILFILIAGMLLSVYQVFPYLERFHGLSLESAQSFIFHPKSLISLFLPLASVTRVPEGTDISMTNGFIGSLLLIIALISLHKKLPWKLTLLLIIGAIFLLASFGPYTPVNTFFYHNIPLLDLFKFPVFYRYFFFISIILSACYYLSIYVDDQSRYRKTIFYTVLGLAIAYLILASYAFQNMDFWNSVVFQGIPEIVKNIREIGFHEAVFLQAFFQFGLFMTVGLFMLFNKYQLRKLLFILVLIELAAAALINSPVTVYAPYNPKEITENLDRYPNGFIVPDKVPIADNADQLNTIDILWRNLGNYTKQPSFDSFSSFDLRGRKILDEQFPILRDSVLLNPVAYLSSDIRAIRTIREDSMDISNKTIYIADDVYKTSEYNIDKQDKKGSVNLIEFKPTQITCEVEVENPQWLVLLQSNFPGWEVRIDNKPVKHYTVNHLFMGVPVPSGKHQIVFSFNRPWIVTGFFISIAGFVILLFFILCLGYPQQRQRWATLFGVIILILAAAQFYNRIQQKQRNQMSKAFYNQSNNLGQWDINKILHFQKSISKPDTMIIGPRFGASDISYLGNFLYQNDYDSLTYCRLNTYESSILPAIIHDFYSIHNIEKFTPNATLLHTSKRDKEQIEHEMDHFIDSSQLYSLEHQITASDITKHKYRIIYFSGMIKGNIESSVFAAMEIHHPYRTNSYKTIDLKKHLVKNDDWNYFILASYLTTHIQDRATIKFYLWNPEKQHFSIQRVKTGSLILSQE